MTTSERQAREDRIAALEADNAKITAERDRYREEASTLRTVCHHMLEAGRHRNAAATLEAQVQAELQQAIRMFIRYDPDRVS